MFTTANTPTTILSAFLLAIPAIYIWYRLTSKPPTRSAPTSPTTEGEKPKTIMQPARNDLAPPKDDPFTMAQLKDFDGSDPDKPVYVSIKGTVFDVSNKRETYGKGGSYNIFAGRDASKALGKSSLKEADAISDYSDLTEAELKVLDDWHSFFSKRYNIVGRVIDLPPLANL